MIKIDWLQINIRNIHPTFKLGVGFELVDTEKQTMLFKKLYELKQDGNVVATITAEPRNEVMSKDLMIIKFENKLLYNSGAHALVHNFLKVNNFKFHSFTRLDLCYDFNYFHGGLHPKEFINQFLTGQIRKTDKCHVYTIAENGHAMNYEYLRFGSNTSDLTYYLYNKTKELADVKDKPYIREMWQKNGLNEHDVWRLEFRIKSGRKLMVNTFNGEVKQLNEWGLELLDQKHLQTLYASLVEKYFDFRYHANDSNVTRLPRVNLFAQFKNFEWELKSPSKKEASGRADKVFVKKMCFLNYELCKLGVDNDHELRFMKDIIRYTITKHDLIEWARYKEFVPPEVLAN